jgi:hypothetical protein
MICTLSGRPAALKPHGTASAGAPASAAGVVNERRVKKRAAACCVLVMGAVKVAMAGAGRC